MSRKHISIPMGMVMKKFYCHKCGERLGRQPTKRTVRRGDIDYRKYNSIGNTYYIGDVEVTEYDFKCPGCNRTMNYNEQCVISKIQKHLQKNVLSNEEIRDNRERAEQIIDRNSKIRFGLFMLFCVAFVICVYLFK